MKYVGQDGRVTKRRSGPKNLTRRVLDIQSELGMGTEGPGAAEIKSQTAFANYLSTGNELPIKELANEWKRNLQLVRQDNEIWEINNAFRLKNIQNLPEKERNQLLEEQNLRAETEGKAKALFDRYSFKG